jgi:hypothetical protein
MFFHLRALFAILEQAIFALATIQIAIFALDPF